ncbi:glycosyltransferase family 39 protein [Wenzhouxiangella marina]|uniref:Glycosyl transferase family 2 n=1 Tax=Wenzhouxiangella marina TaxID=1579979 RepID=A0A0K0XVT0_9GAMM|nr:glycosyltransferase family 39 protein [Wenzhouxiangella marina]AKS41793.1 Glycosyl transferase family 2 [Wenzhouxiangella marina]MBB6086445.1 dolichol-phosphate mannosyltransferase [Wenzhouxiangella marina]
MSSASPSNPAAPRASIVVPTLNEADSISELIERILASMPEDISFETLVVDDASEDGTAALARKWSDRHPVRVIERQGPRDLSGSVLDGAREARGEWVVVMDADGSHPPERIGALLRPLLENRCDLTVGSRHAPGGATEGWPIHRHLASGLATALAWPFTEVRDPMAGFFATRRERLLALPGHAAGYKILLELLVQGGDSLRTEEVPIRFEDRQKGRSKLGLKQQLTYLKRLTYLAGGRVSGSSAGKFILVGLSGMLVDLLIFQALIGQQARLGTAHMASFVVATLTNFALNYRWTFRGDAQAELSLPLRYLRFFIVAVMALMIRGGVLVLLVDVLGLSPMAAIVPAIVVTAGVNYLGSAFYVFASTASGIVPRVRWHLAILGLLLYVVILRLLYMGHVALIPDEMYYWVYSQRPDLSYLDHPPLVAWLIAAGTRIAGDTIFGVRLMLIPLTLVTAWLVYLYGATMGGRTAGLMGVLAVTVLPFFSLSGLLMTPDASMLLAWVGALYCFKRALIDDSPAAFIGLGLAMGIGLLSKYSIALLALAGLIFMLGDRRCWHWFRRPEPYLAVLLTTLIVSPVLVWNAENQWASLWFQSTRRLFENPEFASHLVIVYALLLLSPVVAIAGFIALGPVGRRLAPDPRKRRFMVIMTAVPLGFFLVYGLFTVVKFHWTLPAWIALLPMIAALLSPPGTEPEAAQRPSWQHRLAAAWVPSILVLVLAYGLLLHALTLGLPGLRMTDFGTGYLSWQEAASEIQAIEREIEAQTGQQPIIASTTKWSGAAALAWQYRDRGFEHLTGQNLIGMSGSMWEYWFDETTDPDRPVLLFNRSPKLIDEPWLEQALIRLGPLEHRHLEQSGTTGGELYYRIGQGFRPEQLRTPDRIPD